MVRRTRRYAYPHAMAPPNTSGTIVLPLGATTNRGSPGFDKTFPSQASYEVMAYPEWDVFVGGANEVVKRALPNQMMSTYLPITFTFIPMVILVMLFPFMWLSPMPYWVLLLVMGLVIAISWITMSATRAHAAKKFVKMYECLTAHCNESNKLFAPRGLIWSLRYAATPRGTNQAVWLEGSLSPAAQAQLPQHHYAPVPNAYPIDPNPYAPASANPVFGWPGPAQAPAPYPVAAYPAYPPGPHPPDIPQSSEPSGFGRV